MLAGARGESFTVDDDGSVAVAVDAQFQGQPLRLDEHADPGQNTTRIVVTLGGDVVMQLETELGDQGVIATATYGTAFQGVSQARFTTDGQTLNGTLDGRAINPLSVDAPISELTFADGGPPPDAQVDPDLVQAIQALFTQGDQQSGSCQTGSANTRRNATGRRGQPRDLTLDCIKAQASCAGLLSGCLAAAIGVGATVCGIVTLGICAPAAAGAGVAYCAYQVAKCARNAKYGSSCCPVRCGGDVDNLLGDDPRCCAADQTCLDPNSDRECCGAGTVSCGGDCCPMASCVNGTCCKLPDGTFQEGCGGQCCAPLSPCCGGACCSGTCLGNNCCEFPNVACGGVCCQTICCNEVCCAPGQICADNQCTTPDPCPNRCSDGQCCPQGQSCCFGAGSCPSDRPICCGDPAQGFPGCVDFCLH